MKPYTAEQVQAKIKHADYHAVPNTCTVVCTVVLDNGFTITKAATCNDPRNYSKEFGKKLAYKKCECQAMEHYGFLALQEAMEVCASCGELKAYADMCFTTTNYICNECDKFEMKKEKWRDM